MGHKNKVGKKLGKRELNKIVMSLPKSFEFVKKTVVVDGKEAREFVLAGKANMPEGQHVSELIPYKAYKVEILKEIPWNHAAYIKRYVKQYGKDEYLQHYMEFFSLHHNQLMLDHPERFI